MVRIKGLISIMLVCAVVFENCTSDQGRSELGVLTPSSGEIGVMEPSKEEGEADLQKGAVKLSDGTTWLLNKDLVVWKEDGALLVGNLDADATSENKTLQDKISPDESTKIEAVDPVLAELAKQTPDVKQEEVTEKTYQVKVERDGKEQTVEVKTGVIANRLRENIVKTLKNETVNRHNLLLEEIANWNFGCLLSSEDAEKVVNKTDESAEKNNKSGTTIELSQEQIDFFRAELADWDTHLDTIRASLQAWNQTDSNSSEEENVTVNYWDDKVYQSLKKKINQSWKAGENIRSKENLLTEEENRMLLAGMKANISVQSDTEYKSYSLRSSGNVIRIVFTLKQKMTFRSDYPVKSEIQAEKSKDGKEKSYTRTSEFAIYFELENGEEIDAEGWENGDLYEGNKQYNEGLRVTETDKDSISICKVSGLDKKAAEKSVNATIETISKQYYEKYKENIDLFEKTYHADGYSQDGIKLMSCDITVKRHPKQDKVINLKKYAKYMNGKVLSVLGSIDKNLITDIEAEITYYGDPDKFSDVELPTEDELQTLYFSSEDEEGTEGIRRTLDEYTGEEVSLETEEDTKVECGVDKVENAFLLPDIYVDEAFKEEKDARIVKITDEEEKRKEKYQINHGASERYFAINVNLDNGKQVLLSDLFDTEKVAKFLTTEKDELGMACFDADQVAEIMGFSGTQEQGKKEQYYYKDYTIVHNVKTGEWKFTTKKNGGISIPKHLQSVAKKYWYSKVETRSDEKVLNAVFKELLTDSKDRKKCIKQLKQIEYANVEIEKVRILSAYEQLKDVFKSKQSDSRFLLSSQNFVVFQSQLYKMLGTCKSIYGEGSAFRGVYNSYNTDLFTRVFIGGFNLSLTTGKEIQERANQFYNYVDRAGVKYENVFEKYRTRTKDTYGGTVNRKNVMFLDVNLLEWMSLTGGFRNLLYGGDVATYSYTGEMQKAVEEFSNRDVETFVYNAQMLYAMLGGDAKDTDFEGMGQQYMIQYYVRISEDESLHSLLQKSLEALRKKRIRIKEEIKAIENDTFDYSNFTITIREDNREELVKRYDRWISELKETYRTCEELYDEKILTTVRKNAADKFNNHQVFWGIMGMNSYSFCLDAPSYSSFGYGEMWSGSLLDQYGGTGTRYARVNVTISDDIRNKIDKMKQIADETGNSLTLPKDVVEELNLFSFKEVGTSDYRSFSKQYVIKSTGDKMGEYTLNFKAILDGGTMLGGNIYENKEYWDAFQLAREELEKERKGDYTEKKEIKIEEKDALGAQVKTILADLKTQRDEFNKTFKELEESKSGEVYSNLVNLAQAYSLSEFLNGDYTKKVTETNMKNFLAGWPDDYKFSVTTVDKLLSSPVSIFLDDTNTGELMRNVDSLYARDFEEMMEEKGDEDTPISSAQIYVEAEIGGKQRQIIFLMPYLSYDFVGMKDDEDYEELLKEYEVMLEE